MKIEHWALIAGVLVLAAIMYSQNCTTCKGKQAILSGLSGYDVWPGAGPGVPTRGARPAGSNG